MAHVIHRPTAREVYRCGVCVYTLPVYAKRRPLSHLSCHIRPLVIFTPSAIDKHSSLRRHNANSGIHPVKITDAPCTQLLNCHILRDPTIPRRTSFNEPVFRSYAFGRTSPIRIYTLPLLRAFPVDLVLLPDAHGVTDITHCAGVFITLH